MRTRSKAIICAVAIGALSHLALRPSKTDFESGNESAQMNEWSSSTGSYKGDTVLEMARYLERDGRDLVSVAPEDLMPDSMPIDWTKYSEQRGWNAIDGSYGAFFSGSVEDQAIKRMLVLQAGRKIVGEDSMSRDEEIYAQAYDELTANPNQAIIALRNSLGVLPISHAEDRAHLLYLLEKVGTEYPEIQLSAKEALVTEIHREGATFQSGQSVQQYGPVAALKSYFVLETNPANRSKAAFNVISKQSSDEVFLAVLEMTLNDGSMRAPATENRQSDQN